MPNERLFDLTIRVAEVNDAALAQLRCELGYETTESEMQMRPERIANDDRYCTFVAVDDGKVCGMMGTLTSLSYEHNDLGGRILALVTLRTMRRHERFEPIFGLTATGRTTVEALRLKQPEPVNLRRLLYAAGEHPQPETEDALI